jgi:tRNA pseudouridine(55) synthase
MKKYATIEKRVGETPLEAVERLRAQEKLPREIPLAYAGRLDPMATGKLLVLVGDECKRQTEYHSLDKEYEFEVLFGVGSDTGDVLGIVHGCEVVPILEEALNVAAARWVGDIALPYPHFSSKTVLGKPLHVWTLENRLNEIEIPLARSRVYSLKLLDLKVIALENLLETVSAKIESIPEVTDPRKALGRDFRRTDVRKSWAVIRENRQVQNFYVARFQCIASSGTYMRSLAEKIAEDLGTCGLALSIHRTVMGIYYPIWGGYGIWTKKF